MLKSRPAVLLLPMDASNHEDMEHMLFGYYKPKGLPTRSLLLVGCSAEFEEKAYLIRGALKVERLYNLNG